MKMKAYKKTLLEALHAAGKLLYQSLCDKKHVEFKGGVDLVTSIDKESEKTIISIIKNRFPRHAILAEESKPEGSSPYRWIIDPIDGTTNFAHGFPHACVSIALEEKGQIIVAGVLDPFRNECFTAEIGKGAYVNDARIVISQTEKLNHALLATGFPYDRREKVDKYIRLYADFMMNSQGIRRVGSAALDLCYVACGRIDGFWELKLHPWDTAAGLLIVREAGGTVTDFKNNPYNPFMPQILASNGLIHKEMLKTLEPFCEIGL